MMTLEQFYATHLRPNAIIIPGRVTRSMHKRRSGFSVPGETSVAESGRGLEGLQLLRRFRGDSSRGKKN